MESHDKPSGEEEERRALRRRPGTRARIRPGPLSRNPLDKLDTMRQHDGPVRRENNRQEEAVSPQQYMLAPGTVLDDHYRISRLLGEGGNGEVYLAEHLQLRVPVAIKVLRWVAGFQPTQRRRFAREARAIALINHPNVVGLLGVGRVHESDYMAMEFVNGPSMDTWMDALPTMPTLRVVRALMNDILAGLQAAHELDIVHRDLKPANVMVTGGDTDDDLPGAKITDFGLAHLEHPGDTSTDTLTKEHSIGGTPSYMSPEQCRSLRVDARADLYSVGCILTFLLQGDAPFQAASYMDVMAKQMYAPPPALRRPGNAEPVPEAVEQLRLELLAKDPSGRPGSAKETRERLDAAFDAPSNKKTTIRPGALGERMSRVRAWESTAKDSRTPSLNNMAAATEDIEVAVVRQRKGEEGVNDFVIMGLGQVGMRVREYPFGKPVALSTCVLVVDAVDDLSAIEHWIGANRAAEVAIVVCTRRAGIRELTQLAEAGVSEVVGYPLDATKLSMRIHRAWKVLKRRGK